MDPVAEFFVHNIVVVYFFYGLAFFMMGVVIWIESGRSSEFRIGRVFILLAGFGILHGLHEWFEMFKKLSDSQATNIPSWLLLDEVRIAHLVISFLLLIMFGVRLLYTTHNKDGGETRITALATGGLFALWLASIAATYWQYQPAKLEFVGAVDVLARYILGIPGALLAAWAILLEQRSFRARGMKGFGLDLQWAAWALILYGVVGQVFPTKSFLFPSNVVNSELFLNLFGFPVQFFRATEAVIMSIFFIRALRAFELERQQNLAKANEARIAAQQATLETQRQAQKATEALNLQLREREVMLGELLHQVVSAQENERQRIARELHDGAGQILTGIGLGLVAASDSVASDPTRAEQQLMELKRMNSIALEELHNVICDLRPSVLDDLGLVPAINTQVREFSERTGVPSEFHVEGKRRRVRPDIETIVFRIAQEALTNVAKHAKATAVDVRLCFNQQVLTLIVEDNGSGFDPEEAVTAPGQRSAWGLLGMKERVALVGGSCEIKSQIGAGTSIKAVVPIMEGNAN